MEFTVLKHRLLFVFAFFSCTKGNSFLLAKTFYCNWYYKLKQSTTQSVFSFYLSCFHPSQPFTGWKELWKGQTRTPAYLCIASKISVKILLLMWPPKQLSNKSELKLSRLMFLPGKANTTIWDIDFHLGAKLQWLKVLLAR